MKILLIGYGKMGQAIEKLALKKGYQVEKVDQAEELVEAVEKRPDVAIEFTEPSQAFNNIRICLENLVPVVSGTTGWLNDKSKADTISEENGTPFFYASNFSLGVNIFFRSASYLARQLSSYPDYSVSIEEKHHINKKDAPSGTAITLAEKTIENLDHKSSWTLMSSDSNISEDILPITSIREGEVPGTHTLAFIGELDKIELRHTAFDRSVFAKGALVAAEWIQGKKGVLGMDDLLKFS